MIESFRNLIVWQKSRELVKEVYLLTYKYPQEEVHGLTNQSRRAAVSVPSNISEGYQRQTKKEYIQFLYISFGSTSELETQILLALDLKFISQIECDTILVKVHEIQKMLYSLIKKLKETKA